jgi:hypothetical protein
MFIVTLRDCCWITAPVKSYRTFVSHQERILAEAYYHISHQQLSRINQYNILRADVIFWLLIFNWIYLIWIHDVISRYQRSMEIVG